MIPEMDSRSEAWGAHSQLPLPLTALKDGHIVDPNGWTVAQCYGDYSEEYASLIVAAVNSRDTLLDAAKDIVAMVATRDVRSFVWGSDRVENLRAAISKAEELAP